MTFEPIIQELRQDPDMMLQKEILIVALDKNQDCMLADAVLFRPDSGSEEALSFEVCFNTDPPDDATIFRENGEELLTIFETRPNSRTKVPNGIHLDPEALDFPCVVFWNCGDRPLTAVEIWLEPGEHSVVRLFSPQEMAQICGEVMGWDSLPPEDEAEEY